MIYEPAEDSELLGDVVEELVKGKVLDMGTGSGYQALKAAKKRSVKGVLAVDINKHAIDKVRGSHKKIRVKESNLFSKVTGKFDWIVFNPPYLPKDRKIEDTALYGGKHGYEIPVRFIEEMGNHLAPDGNVLLLFSSITKPKKIRETLDKELYQYEEVARQRVFMEDLIVYKIWKSPIREMIEDRGVKDLRYFSKGKRGVILVGKYRGKKIAVKVKNPSSEAIGRIRNEAQALKTMNLDGIGPKLAFAQDEFLAYYFVEGKFTYDYMREASAKNIRIVLRKVLKQCFIMDNYKLAKEEMHRPIKHIIIKGTKPVMIDFERMHVVAKPHNVTQFVTFLTGAAMMQIYKSKKMKVNKNTLQRLAREYSKDYSKKAFNEIVKEI